MFSFDSILFSIDSHQNGIADSLNVISEKPFSVRRIYTKFVICLYIFITKQFNGVNSASKRTKVNSELC